MKKEISKTSFKAIIALVFLIIGYQTAFFIQKASINYILAKQDHQDTVYIVSSSDISTNNRDIYDKIRQYKSNNQSINNSTFHLDDKDIFDNKKGSNKPLSKNDKTASNSKESGKYHSSNKEISKKYIAIKKYSKHNSYVRKIRKRTYDKFKFNPNKISIDSLIALGFSEKQALSIDKYRRKIGRFWRKEDFKKIYVVSDSLYERLKDCIVIEKLDINKADSAEFESLPYIGAYLAGKIVKYRTDLQGFSNIEQLLEIKYFDNDRLDKIREFIELKKVKAYPLWDLSLEELIKHPYIDKHTAEAIITFKHFKDSSLWTIKDLINAGIINNNSRLCSINIHDIN